MATVTFLLRRIRMLMWRWILRIWLAGPFLLSSTGPALAIKCSSLYMTEVYLWEFCVLFCFIQSYFLAPQLKVAENRLTVTGEKGYRMIRATHGMCWERSTDRVILFVHQFSISRCYMGNLVLWGMYPYKHFRTLHVLHDSKWFIVLLQKGVCILYMHLILGPPCPFSSFALISCWTYSGLSMSKLEIDMKGLIYSL